MFPDPVTVAGAGREGVVTVLDYCHHLDLNEGIFLWSYDSAQRSSAPPRSPALRMLRY